MLNSLVIKNFRMLEDFTVSKLGRVNLIVGKNNSGKSTVLEALRIYAGNANPKLLENITESHDEVFDTNCKEFYSNREYKTGEYILIAESECDETIKNGIRQFRFICRTKTEQELYHAEGKLAYRNKEELEEQILCSFIPTQFVAIKELEHDWSEINLTDNEDIVAQILQIIRPDFKRLAFDGDGNKRWIKVRLANESKPVPLKSLGDGMLRILQIAIKLVSAQGGFLLIDEFENGLHYSTQEKIWALLFEMAEKLDIQVFATTHSWDCIESFTKVAIERKDVGGVLFRMGKSVRTSDKGKVIATVFSEDELATMTQIDMEIR